MSFSCPHFRPEAEHCLRLKTDCVPGRRGCVLEGKAEFAVPAEQRVRELEEEKRRRRLIGTELGGIEGSGSGVESAAGISPRLRGGHGKNG